MAEVASIISLIGSCSQILNELVDIIAKSRGLPAKKGVRDEVNSKLKELEVELPIMQALLNKKNSSADPKDEVLMHWLDALRNVKTDILDVFHEYIYLFNADTVGGTDFMLSGKQIFRVDSNNNIAWSALSSNIDNVKSSLRNITDMRVRYGIKVRHSEESSSDANRLMLPDNFVSCLLYCTVFPEDYEIERNRLIRLWVSQGYVRKDEGGKSLEEVAEDYLNQLVFRGLLNATERNESGRVRRVKVSIGLREFLMARSREENFCNRYFRNLEEKLVDRFRHVPIVDADQIDPNLKRNFSKLWSFHVFSSIPPQILSNLRVLKVLDLYNVPINFLPDSIVELYNLHYLSIKGSKVLKLPQGLGRLRNLETLDASYTNIEYIPSGVTKLENLRHLMAKRLHRQTSRSAAISIGVHVPEGICNLHNLQTLKAVLASDGLVKGLRNLTNLRCLDIRLVKDEHCMELSASISKMKFLCRLTVMPKYSNLQLKDIASPPTQLQNIGIYGKLKDGVLPLWIGSLPKLTHMVLKFSGLSKHSVSSLFNLQNLVSLHLMQVSDEKKLKFHSGSLPELKYLSLHQMINLRDIQIENDALANLQELSLVKCSRLSRIPQGILYLTNLKKLELEDMPKELVMIVQNALRNSEDEQLVWKIPTIRILTGKEGKWHEEILSRPLML